MIFLMSGHSNFIPYSSPATNTSFIVLVYCMTTCLVNELEKFLIVEVENSNDICYTT